MTYFAITGRLHGDDEDWCSLIQADTAEVARQAFIDETRETNGVTPEDAARDIAEGYEDSNVYITTVLTSETPIQIL